MKFGLPQKFSLYARLLVLCLGASAIIVTIAIAGLHSHRNKVHANELSVELATIAEAVGPVVMEQLAVGDLEGAVKSMSVFAASPFVKCAELIQSGQVTMSWPPSFCLHLAGEENKLQTPIITDSGKVATIAFVIENKSFRSMLIRETFVLTATILVIVLAIFLVLTISFRRVVLHPLELLKTAMVLSTPRGPVRGELVNDDEVGELVNAYNKLVAGSRLFIRRLDQSQASLATSEKRFRDLAEVSGDWFFEMDRDLRLTFMSDNFYTLSGLTSDQVIGKLRSEIAADIDTNPNWKKHLEDLAAHREFRRFEYQVRTTRGHLMDISISAVPHYDDAKKFIGYHGIGVDISSLKEKEHQLAEANRNFGDSVSYASSIQRSLLPNAETLSQHLGTARTIWQPKDLVGGDFYWCKSIGNVDYLVFFDCTGHGVPGAFMTLIVTSVLDQIAVSAPSALKASRVLQLIHDGVCRSLNITVEKGGADGLDCAVIRLDRSEDSIEFAGASIDLFEISPDGTVERHRGSRATLGYEFEKRPGDHPSVSLRAGSNSYVVTSDGLLTQVGDKTKRVLGNRRFTEALGEVGENSPAKLLRATGRLLKNWQGREDRRDDVAVVCFKPNDF